VCEVFDCDAELEVVERPQAVDEGPEARGEVDGMREAAGELGGGVVARG
jgi:hypothetical protein